MNKIFKLLTFFMLIFIFVNILKGICFREDDLDHTHFLNKFNKKTSADNINFLILGVDKEEIRTDVIFVVSLNKKTNTVNILSIPRDTMVKVEEDTIDMMEYGKNINSDRLVKINEVHSYAGRKYANKITTYEVERLLDINIDYYAKVNISAFRNVVDTIGGVDINVPERMFYSDPVQALYINLYPGMQHLDGRKAEQLVRYRSYRNGDIGRIQIQQMFLKEFAKKILSKEKLTDIGVLTDLAKTMFTYVETDFNIMEIGDYIGIAKNINVDSVNMETLPGQMGVQIRGIDFYKTNPKEVHKASSRLLAYLDKGAKKETIELSSSAKIYGLSTYYLSKLKSYGFENIKYINETKDNKYTKIILKDKKNTKYYEQLFYKPEIIVDEAQLKEGIDVKIILGEMEVR
ncbi:MAG: LCP family protein [Clostridia bacterium]|nr:LCP family protein [Clostridia bacterium]